MNIEEMTSVLHQYRVNCLHIDERGAVSIIFDRSQGLAVHGLAFGCKGVRFAPGAMNVSVADLVLGDLHEPAVALILDAGWFRKNFNKESNGYFLLHDHSVHTSNTVLISMHL